MRRGLKDGGGPAPGTGSGLNLSDSPALVARRFKEGRIAEEDESEEEAEEAEEDEEERGIARDGRVRMIVGSKGVGKLWRYTSLGRPIGDMKIELAPESGGWVGGWGSGGGWRVARPASGCITGFRRRLTSVNR